MKRLTTIVTLAVLLLAYSVPPVLAGSPDGQEEGGRSRQEGSGRDAGTRERPDQPLDVNALVRMLPPTTTPLRVGDTLTLEIAITTRQDVGHAPFHVRFDPAVLRFESGEEGVFLGNDGATTAFFANATTAGDAVVVGLSRLGRAPGAEGEGRLCTLHFTAVGPGDAALAFARASVRDGYNRILASRFDTANVRVR